MKIIVDKMPNDVIDCIFFRNGSCTVLSNATFSKSCNIHTDLCPLKPITDFHAENVIAKYQDGSYTTQSYRIVDYEGDVND